MRLLLIILLMLKSIAAGKELSNILISISVGMYIGNG